MHFTCAARTDVGIVRSGNEDNYLMLADRGIFIVADGMGGHAAGEVASEMAVRITSHQIGSLRGMTDEQAGEKVRGAIRAANDAIFERTLAEQDKRGMGTTATVLALLPGRYLIGQVGDSRAYLLRNGQFQQLTKDHSYVQEQVDAGLLTSIAAMKLRTMIRAKRTAGRSRTRARVDRVSGCVAAGASLHVRMALKAGPKWWLAVLIALPAEALWGTHRRSRQRRSATQGSRERRRHAGEESGRAGLSVDRGPDRHPACVDRVLPIAPEGQRVLRMDLTRCGSIRSCSSPTSCGSRRRSCGGARRNGCCSSTSFRSSALPAWSCSHFWRRRASSSRKRLTRHHGRKRRDVYQINAIPINCPNGISTTAPRAAYPPQRVVDPTPKRNAVMHSGGPDSSTSVMSGRAREAFISYSGHESEYALKDTVFAFTDEWKAVGGPTPERIIVEMKRLADAARDQLAQRSNYSPERARLISEVLARAATWCVDRYYANPVK